jgi:hypothetical protein
MPAKDFLFPIALDPFGAGVPTGHIAGRVQHQDRVIRNSLHQQLETLLLQRARGNLRLQLGIEGAQFPAAGEAQHARHQHPHHDRGGGGYRGGQRFRGQRDDIKGPPGREPGQHMAGATEYEQPADQDPDPRIGGVSALQKVDGERCGNGKIGSRHHTISGCIQPDERWIHGRISALRRRYPFSISSDICSMIVPIRQRLSESLIVPLSRLV